jgi:transposase
VELLHERCAGLDIGKKDLKACVRTPNPSGKRSRRQEIRTFATTTNALLELRDWLVEQKVTLVVMEATGDYWRGAFYLIEDCLNVILVNAAHAKGLPGRKMCLMLRGCVRGVSAACSRRRSCPRSRSGSCGT